MMSLRPLLSTIQICQKQRMVLSVCQSLNRYRFRPVSLSAFQCSYNEKSSTKVENTDHLPENDKVLHRRKDPHEDYEYYKKFTTIVKDLDKKTPSELKTSKVTEEDCSSSSVTSLLPDTVERSSPTQFPVKDRSLEAETLHVVPVGDNLKDAEKSSILSNNADPTGETAISEDSRDFSRPFLQTSATKTASDIMPPKESADLVRELYRRRYTEITTSYNLAVYVNESETLKQLVSLGVDLSAVEKVQGAANLIIKLDFESDVKPYLLFLKDIGVPDDKLAVIITKNPLIFQTSIEDLQSIIDYFKSKRFSTANIPQIVTRAPRLLLMPVSNIDSKLGFYQKMFQLDGNQVREVIFHLPKLITYNAKAIKDIHFQMREFLGFTNSDLKKMFMISPRIFLGNKHIMTQTFDYLHNEMGLSHAQLMQWPKIFRTRLHRIKERHQFLKHVKRHQYDSSKEKYVSLKALVSDDDKTFCFNIAKTSTAEFNQFLKTL